MRCMHIYLYESGLHAQTAYGNIYKRQTCVAWAYTWTSLACKHKQQTCAASSGNNVRLTYAHKTANMRTIDM